MSPAALVVPGLIDHRPVATGIGVAVAELALLVHLSFRYRSKIGPKNWRRLHWGTYAVFLGGAAHGILSGTDTGALPAQMLYAGAVAAVAALTGWRAVTARRAAKPKAAPARQTAPVDERRAREPEGAAGMTPAGGWRRALLVGAAVVAVAAVAVFANLALLDATGEERLGRLNQGDPALTGTTAPAAVTAPRPARTATRARTATAPPAATTGPTPTTTRQRRRGRLGRARPGPRRGRRRLCAPAPPGRTRHDGRVPAAAPLVREIPYADPLALLAAVADDPLVALLHGGTDDARGRHSLLALEPFGVLRSRDGVAERDGRALAAGPWEALRDVVDAARGGDPRRGAVRGRRRGLAGLRAGPPPGAGPAAARRRP